MVLWCGGATNGPKSLLSRAGDAMRADLASILSDLETLTTEQALKRKFDQTFSNLGFNAFT